jgi:hypothetical protein
MAKWPGRTLDELMQTGWTQDAKPVVEDDIFYFLS